MKKFLAAAIASLAFMSGAAFAAPTVQQIETAISQGDWQRADTGLVQVLQAHPNSAHAHYLYAQVLHREGRYADALAQIEQAKSLDPQLRFASPARFQQIEARIRADAARGTTNGRAGNPPVSTQAAAAPAAAAFGATVHHGPSIGAWIGIALLIAVIALVLRWTLRRAKSTEDSKAGDERRDQLRRATELLNAVRTLKLDLKLSSAAGHDVLEKEAEGLETQLRGLVEALSNSANPVPPYQLDDLGRQVESLKARAEGRPDPNAQPAQVAPAGGESAYAREADANFGHQSQGPYPPQQQPPQVIVQQGGGGFGGGMGGLMTGVLLGEMLGGGRDRVVERDVLVDDEGRRVNRDNGGNNDGGVDFGQGSNDWDDGSGSGGVDMGGNDDSGNWDNS